MLLRPTLSYETHSVLPHVRRVLSLPGRGCWLRWLIRAQAEKGDHDRRRFSCFCSGPGSSSGGGPAPRRGGQSADRYGIPERRQEEEKKGPSTRQAGNRAG